MEILSFIILGTAYPVRPIENSLRFLRSSNKLSKKPNFILIEWNFVVYFYFVAF